MIPRNFRKARCQTSVYLHSATGVNSAYSRLRAVMDAFSYSVVFRLRIGDLSKFKFLIDILVFSQEKSIMIKNLKMNQSDLQAGKIYL